MPHNSHHLRQARGSPIALPILGGFCCSSTVRTPGAEHRQTQCQQQTHGADRLPAFHPVDLLVPLRRGATAISKRTSCSLELTPQVQYVMNLADGARPPSSASKNCCTEHSVVWRITASARSGVANRNSVASSTRMRTCTPRGTAVPRASCRSSSCYSRQIKPRHVGCNNRVVELSFPGVCAHSNANSARRQRLSAATKRTETHPGARLKLRGLS